MPVMTKMRDSMPVVFAGLAAVFLLMIIFEWGGQGMIFNKTGDAESLGVVNGRKITRKDYDRIYQAVVEQMKQEAKGAPLTDAQEDQASDRAWDQAVSESLIDASIDRMGITVTDQDVRDQIFDNPPEQVRKMFSDSVTGQFRKDEYIKALRDPRNDTIVRQMESGTRDQLRKMKWQSAAISALRISDEDVKDRYLVDSAKAQVQVVRMIAPNPGPQDMRSISQQEIQAYYDKYKYLYKQPESRKFKFVVFRLSPNSRDTALAMETGKTIAARLKETPNDKLDTLVHEIMADYNEGASGGGRTLLTMRELGKDSSMLSAKKDDVLIVHAGGKLSVVRVMDVIDTARPLAHYRTIIIRTENQEQHTLDSAKAVAEQLLSRVQSGSDFAALARQYSADPRGAVNGGDMGWSEMFDLPPDAQKQVMSAPAGTVIGPVKTPIGYSLIQTLGSTRKMWAVVQVPLTVKPSHQTLQIQQQMANIFHENAVKQGFDEAAKAAGYNVEKNAPAAQKKGTPLFNSHPFVDWIFQASKNDVSPVLKMAQQNFYLVAQLTEITPEGPSPIEEVRERILPEVAKRKVVDAMKARAEQVKAAIGNGDMSAAARTMGDSSLLPATFFMGPAESVNGLPSMEYRINNWAFSANPNDVSPLIKGESGWYVAKLLSRHVPSDQDFELAKAGVRQRLFQEREQRFMVDWIQNQKDNATIADYRVRR